jgi:NAD(P)-dependent dehydrogenase (short-subunit alcohol dehydrogenase family)
MSRLPPGRQVAVVTGAAGGIGRAVAALLVAGGAGVLVTDLDEQDCESVAKEVNAAGAPGRAVACRLDVTDPVSWASAMVLARRRFGYPNVLVNNAGVIGVNDLERTTDDEWARVVDVCQRGTWLGMRAAVPCMDHAGGGAIVNVASVFALVGSSGAFAYHAAKGAVRAMTTAAAVELAGRGIRVNAVYPGMVDTRMTAGVPDEFVDGYVAATPMRRMGTPAEVACAVRFLVSPDAAYITGAELVVDGGYTAR